MIKKINSTEINFVSCGRSGWTAYNVCSSVVDTLIFTIVIAASVATLENALIAEGAAKKPVILVSSIISGGTMFLIKAGMHSWQMSIDKRHII